jgi:hypothetical protein
MAFNLSLQSNQMVPEVVPLGSLGINMGQTVRLSDCQLKGPVSCAFPARIFSVSGCQDPMGTGSDVGSNLPGLVNLQKAIENGPVEIVDLPS